MLTAIADEKKLSFRESTLDDPTQLLDIEQKVIEAERPFNTAIRSKDVNYYDIPTLISNNDSTLLVLEEDGIISATGYERWPP
jgi:hypothetical protein